MNFREQKQVLEYVSGYFSILLRRFPEYAHWLWENHQINRTFSLLELNSDLTREINSKEMSLNNIALSLRRFKQRHFLRIGARDLFGMDDFKTTVQQVSDIAVVSLQICLRLFFTYPHLWLKSSKFNDWEAFANHIDTVIIGLGKLGGKELNYVSDIDLMFLYDTRNAKNPSENKQLSMVAQRFLPKLCTQLINLLEHSYDGDRVFKVDLRLRPAGKDGELVSPLSYAVHHYLVEGQSWERLALLKAIPVAGAITVGNLFIQEIQPFVFRRFLDFQSLEEIKLLRNKILQETPVQPPGPGFNVKLGIGGIREIEFIVQSMQLIYGGRNPDLRIPNTIQALKALSSKGLLDTFTSEKLINAYKFLRKTEHWVQLMNNQITQVIPKNESSLARLAFAVMYADCKVPRPLILNAKNLITPFFDTLKEHVDFVHDRFVELFEPSEKDTHSHIPNRALEDSYFAKFEVKNPNLRTKLLELLEGELVRIKNTEVRKEVQNRCERFVSSIARRPGLITFFDKHHDIFELCLKGLIKSEFIADFITHAPSLSEGIEKDVTKPWLTKAKSLLNGFESFEEKLHWLRRIKNERLISIAIYDIAQGPHGRIIEHLLSELADFIISETYKLVCEERKVSSENLPLAICAMGKLGSREFNYNSDLDIVFIYDPPPEENQEIIPEKVTKLIQRLVRLLSISLNEGPGYEVDMRLRPTGNYGPLIVTKATWVEYYEKVADIWELASLVRFRPVCGKEKLLTEIQSYANKFLNAKKHPEEIWTRLCSLKKRVERERSKSKQDANRVDIKLGPGGIMDIELWCHGTVISWPEKIQVNSMSTRELFKDILKFWKIGNSTSKNLIKTLDILKRLEQRIVLSGYNPKSFGSDHLEKIKILGLLTASELDENSLDWTDLIAMMAKIRKWWDRICKYKEPMDWSVLDELFK